MDDNITEAMQLVLGVMVFIIALSVVMPLFGKLSTTGRSIYEDRLRTRHSNEFDLWDQNYENIDNRYSQFDRKQVTKSSIIPMLHRYYKENFSVKIFDRYGHLKQVFDLGLEGLVGQRTRQGLTPNRNITLTAFDRAIVNDFADANNQLYMFGAPWVGDGKVNKKARFAKERVDLYTSGIEGYINGIKLQYNTRGRDWFSRLRDDQRFEEIVVKYQISGNVSRVADDEVGEDIVVGGAPHDKIEVIYREL